VVGSLQNRQKRGLKGSGPRFCFAVRERDLSEISFTPDLGCHSTGVACRSIGRAFVCAHCGLDGSSNPQGSVGATGGVCQAVSTL
jgi:hypothetical protein